MFHCPTKNTILLEWQLHLEIKKKQTRQNADYRKVLVEPCCKQIIASEIPP